jgi:hypothetical protein
MNAAEFVPGDCTSPGWYTAGMATYEIVPDGLSGYGVECTSPGAFQSVRGFATKTTAQAWINEDRIDKAKAEQVAYRIELRRRAVALRSHSAALRARAAAVLERCAGCRARAAEACQRVFTAR